MNPSVRAYDAWAETYDAHDNPLVAMSDAAVAELRPLVEGARVLELGCGTGRLAGPLLAAGARGYVGLEPSTGMLERARRSSDARITWVHGDLLRLPAGLGVFDFVLTCLVLEHLERLDAAFSSARQALCPGGSFVAIELHPELHARGVHAHFEQDGRTVHLPSISHDAAEMRAACASAGLEPVRLAEWFPDARSIARCEKLARYRGSPVLLELRAVR